MSTTTHMLTPDLYDYLKSVSLREPAVLKKLRQETAQLEMSMMQIAPEQGQFMRLLVQITGAKNILEIGVFTGYSSLSMALALPADGKIVACDISEEWTAIARRYWKEAGVDQKIELRLNPAIHTLEALLDKGKASLFDLAFIDADKEHYDAYYELSLQLIRPGGVILVDNTLWDGKVADPQIDDADTNSIRALNRKLLKDQRVDISMLPVADGLTLARKR